MCVACDEFRLHLSNDGRRVTNHPMMASLLGVCSKKPNFALVFEYREGEETLTSRLARDKSMSWEVKYRIARDIAAACAHAHSLRVKVCDLSSDTVMVRL